jgi:UDP-2-acetamido-2-deoxy-ribo-hexuluronate aminotransferase
MDTIQCAVVLAKLERFEWEIAQRIEVGRRYDALLSAGAPELKRVQVRPDRSSVYAQYTVMTPQRDRLQSALGLRGVPTAVHYPVPLHRQPAYRKYGVDLGLRISDSLAAEVISLPMYPDLELRLQDRIVAATREALATA